MEIILCTLAAREIPTGKPVLPTKPSSDDNSWFRHAFDAKTLLLLTYTTPAAFYSCTRLLVFHYIIGMPDQDAAISLHSQLFNNKVLIQWCKIWINRQDEMIMLNKNRISIFFSRLVIFMWYFQSFYYLG